jgi:hypothetical protein
MRGVLASPRPAPPGRAVAHTREPSVSCLRRAMSNVVSPPRRTRSRGRDAHGCREAAGRTYGSNPPSFSGLGGSSPPQSGVRGRARLALRKRTRRCGGRRQLRRVLSQHSRRPAPPSIRADRSPRAGSAARTLLSRLAAYASASRVCVPQNKQPAAPRRRCSSSNDTRQATESSGSPASPSRSSSSGSAVRSPTRHARCALARARPRGVSKKRIIVNKKWTRTIHLLWRVLKKRKKKPKIMQHLTPLFAHRGRDAHACINGGMCLWRAGEPSLAQSSNARRSAQTQATSQQRRWRVSCSCCCSPWRSLFR